MLFGIETGSFCQQVNKKLLSTHPKGKGAKQPSLEGGKGMNEQDHKEQEMEQSNRPRMEREQSERKRSDRDTVPQRERERSDRPRMESEELHDVLIAISVVEKRLASRIETTEEES